LASFEGDGDVKGTTRLISEQVSHHPPVTACYLWNDDHGVRAEGYTCQEITFNGSVNIKQIGHAILHIDAHNEDYLIPLPNIKVSGLLSGTPYPELNGTYHISSSSGFISEIDFTGKSMLGMKGTKHKFEASLYRAEDTKRDPLYTATGTWNDTFTIHDNTTQTDLETYNTNAIPGAPLIVPPLSEQDPWESRRAWAGVIDALNHGDMRRTSDEKGKVEQGQREMRKKEETEGKKWQATFFTRTTEDPVFDRLAASIGVSLEADRTVGVWKFDHGKAKEAKPPYHGDLMPVG